MRKNGSMERAVEEAVNIVRATMAGSSHCTDPLRSVQFFFFATYGLYANKTEAQQIILICASV